MMKNMNDWSHLERFEQMPEGWQIDKTWGSPLHGYVPISNGKSRLKGGRKGLLKVKTTKKQQNNPSSIAIKKKELPAKPLKNKGNTSTPQDVAQPLNQLARAKFKEKLMQELLFDLTVCKLEGWDYTEYVGQLKQLIDETAQKVKATKK